MPADSIPLRWTLRGAVVRLPGEIDPTNSEQVHTALLDALNAAPAVLVADMTATTYCGWEGLRVLVNTHQAAQRAGIALRIAGVRTTVRRVLELTGATELLDVYPSTGAALAPGTAQPDRAGAEAGAEG